MSQKPSLRSAPRDIVTTADNGHTTLSAPKALEARNKAIIERYFREALDQRKIEVMAELMAPDVVLHRPGYDVHGAEAAVQRWRAISKDFSTFTSELSGMIAEGDMVAAQVYHRTKMRPHTFRSRGVSVTLTKEQEVNWGAIVQFRLTDGKIVEEWVMRDELGILTQMGQIAVER
jgi:predicted SnoaL-like aldol condensation-catalyzing enzyme